MNITIQFCSGQWSKLILVQLILKPYSQSYLHNLFFFQSSGILLTSISCLEALSHLFWQHDQPESVIFSKLYWNRDHDSLFSSSFFLSHNFPFKDLLIQSWLKAYNILFLLLLSNPSFLPTCCSSVIKTVRMALSPELECKAAIAPWVVYPRAEFWPWHQTFRALFWHHLHWFTKFKWKIEVSCSVIWIM